MKRLVLSLSLLYSASTVAIAGEPPRQSSQSSPISNTRQYIPQVEITSSNTVAKAPDSLLSKTRDIAQKIIQEPVKAFDVKGESGGTFVKLRWTRTHYVGDYVFISEQPIEVGYEDDGSLYSSGPTVHLGNVSKEDYPEIVLPQLKPDRKYYCAVLPDVTSSDSYSDYYVHTPNTVVVPAYFEIRTMKRNVLLTVEKISVSDDSDGLSDGDLAFSFQIARPNIAISTADPDDFLDDARYPSSGSIQVGSGESVFPNKQLLALNVKDELKFAISCMDDDDDAFTPSGGGLSLHSYTYLGTFNNNLAEANSKVWTLDVSGGTYESEPNVLPEYPQWFDYWQMETKHTTFIRSVVGNDESDLSYVVTIKASIYYSE